MVVCCVELYLTDYSLALLKQPQLLFSFGDILCAQSKENRSGTKHDNVVIHAMHTCLKKKPLLISFNESSDSFWQAISALMQFFCARLWKGYWVLSRILPLGGIWWKMEQQHRTNKTIGRNHPLTSMSLRHLERKKKFLF